MLSAFANAFRTPDLRRKILFTLFILAVFRLGSVIPVPNVNVTTSTPVLPRRAPVPPPVCTR